MATRFAGDLFNIAYDDSGDVESSVLMSKFPELRNVGSFPASTKPSLADFFAKKTYDNPQLTGGGFAPKPFGGFKVSGY